MVEGLFLFCRAGFEGEAGAEVVDLVRARGGDAHARPGAGYVLVEAPAGAADQALEGIGSIDLAFSRQAFRSYEAVPLPPRGDRAAVLVEAVARLVARVGLPGFCEVFVEAPDTDTGRPRWPLCGRLQEEMAARLQAQGLLGGRFQGVRLHICLADRGVARTGISDPGRSSPWPQGIPRLRFPDGAPSRSALKLEEAFLVFLPEGERRVRLRPGMRAVDLGASPGGWTWQLAARGLVVAAVDNGPVDRALLETGLVEHVRADGFTWRPARPVHWLVCDMVTAPARVAKLVGLWGARGLCQEAIFNLKLPSSRRLAEVRRCAGIIARELGAVGAQHVLRFKHLYHDREEVTGHLWLAPRAPADAPRVAPRARRERSATPPPGRGRRDGRGKSRGEATVKKRR